MREKFNTSAVDDLGNEFSIDASDVLIIRGLQDDPESDGKTHYEYYFNQAAASALEESLVKEYGTERTLESILMDEFDYCNGIGTLKMYCEEKGIDCSFEEG